MEVLKGPDWSGADTWVVTLFRRRLSESPVLSHLRASSDKDGQNFSVVHHAPGLCGNIPGNDLARLRIERNLAAMWQEIIINGRTGWVNADYIARTDFVHDAAPRPLRDRGRGCGLSDCGICFSRTRTPFFFR